MIHSAGALEAEAEVGRLSKLGLKIIVNGGCQKNCVNDYTCGLPEFVNYGLALMVYAVRYPAVFWNTNKTFSFLFSSALLFNGVQVIAHIHKFALIFVLTFAQ